MNSKDSPVTKASSNHKNLLGNGTSKYPMTYCTCIPSCFVVNYCRSYKATTPLNIRPFKTITYFTTPLNIRPFKTITYFTGFLELQLGLVGQYTQNFYSAYMYFHVYFLFSYTTLITSVQL